MGFLSKLLGRDRVPRWANYLSAKDYAAFQSQLQAQLDKDPKVTAVHWEEGGWDREGGQELGMHNLLAKWHNASDAERPLIIENHIRIVLTAYEATILPWEVASEMIRVYLYPGGGLPGEMFRMDKLPGTETVIALDLEDRMSTVNDEMMEAWGKTPEELFQLGLVNLAKKEHYAHDRHQINPNYAVDVFHGESFYVAAQVLRMDDWLDPSEDVLFLIPNRHTLIWTRDINEARANPQVFSTFLRGMERMPGPVSFETYQRIGGEISIVS